MLSRTLLILSLLGSSSAWAQSMWGTGAYGGMQACSYPQQVAQGAVSEDDATREAREAVAEIQARLKAKKSEKKKVDKQVERSHQDVERGISDDYVDFVFEHIENSRQCASYKGMQSGEGEEVQAGGTEGGNKIPEANMIPIQSFSKEEWSRYCDASKPGAVSNTICSDGKFQQREGRATATSCKKGLTEYRKNYALQDKLQREIEDLEDSLKNAKRDLTDAKKDAAEERQASTEGGVCLECMAKSNGNSVVQPQTDWASVIGNVGVGLTSMYMGYKTNKTISNNNANLGWPTDPYATQGYGYGLGAIGTGLGQAIGGGSGIYGSMSGSMGQGGFGCAGNNGGPYGMAGPYGGMNGNGMWGNPYAMNNGMGGGMFNSGMGPWGMNGYNSNGMMGNMMGNMMGSMMGGMMGGSMMSGSMMSGNSQYQQQLMQLQMQQYQSQMQKYSTINSLQQEMYNLMYRIQAIQYGGSYSTGSLGTLGLGTTSSSYITPLPGSTSTGVSTILGTAR